MTLRASPLCWAGAALGGAACAGIVAEDPPDCSNLSDLTSVPLGGGFSAEDSGAAGIDCQDRAIRAAEMIRDMIPSEGTQCVSDNDCWLINSPRSFQLTTHCRGGYAIPVSRAWIPRVQATIEVANEAVCQDAPYDHFYMVPHACLADLGRLQAPFCEAGFCSIYTCIFVPPNP